MVRERKVLLKVRNVGKKFGGIQALFDCSFDIVQGELMGLIGPNGAGKTTVFNLLSGVLKPSSGEIFFNGENITDFSPPRTARAGIARTFQNIRLFGDLSVLDNIKVAFHMRHGPGFFNTVFHSAKFRRTETEITRKAMTFAEMMGLSHLINEPAKKLPYGDQRKMEIARALATDPKLLLLDEPAAGMNARETADLMGTIKQVVSDHDMTVLLVEHDMRLVMNLCRRIQVLNQGRVLARGTPEEIRHSPDVIKAYLGAPKEEVHA